MKNQRSIILLLVVLLTSHTTLIGQSLMTIGKVYTSETFGFLKGNNNYKIVLSNESNDPCVFDLKRGMLMYLTPIPKSMAKSGDKYIVKGVTFMTRKGVKVISDDPLRIYLNDYKSITPFGLKMGMSKSEVEEKTGKLELKELENIGPEYKTAFLWKMPQLAGMTSRITFKSDTVISVSFNVKVQFLEHFMNKRDQTNNFKGIEYKDIIETGNRIIDQIGLYELGDRFGTVNESLIKGSSPKEVFQIMPRLLNASKIELNKNSNARVLYCLNNINGFDMLDAISFFFQFTSTKNNGDNDFNNYVWTKDSLGNQYILHKTDLPLYQICNKHYIYKFSYTGGANYVVVDLIEPRENPLLDFDGNRWIKLIGMKDKNELLVSLVKKLNQLSPVEQKELRNYYGRIGYSMVYEKLGLTINYAKNGRVENIIFKSKYVGLLPHHDKEVNNRRQTQEYKTYHRTTLVVAKSNLYGGSRLKSAASNLAEAYKVSKGVSYEFPDLDMSKCVPLMNYGNRGFDSNFTCE